VVERRVMPPLGHFSLIRFERAAVVVAVAQQAGAVAAKGHAGPSLVPEPGLVRGPSP
jgi:hypothetical protein